MGAMSPRTAMIGIECNLGGDAVCAIGRGGHARWVLLEVSSINSNLIKCWVYHCRFLGKTVSLYIDYANNPASL